MWGKENDQYRLNPAAAQARILSQITALRIRKNERQLKSFHNQTRIRIQNSERNKAKLLPPPLPTSTALTTVTNCKKKKVSKPKIIRRRKKTGERVAVARRMRASEERRATQERRRAVNEATTRAHIKELRENRLAEREAKEAKMREAEEMRLMYAEDVVSARVSKHFEEKIAIEKAEKQKQILKIRYIDGLRNIFFNEKPQYFNENRAIMFAAYYGRNPNISPEQQDLGRQFVTAVRENNFEEVQRLISEERVPINSGMSGCCGHIPAVNLGCELGHCQIVEYLLEHGAIPEHNDCYGFSANPIFECTKQKKFGVLDSDGRPNEDRRSDAMNEKILKLLLQYHYINDFEYNREWNGMTMKEVSDQSKWWKQTGRSRFTDEHKMAMLLDAGVLTCLDTTDIGEAASIYGPHFFSWIVESLCTAADGISNCNMFNDLLEDVLGNYSMTMDENERNCSPSEILQCMQILLEHGAMVTKEQFKNILFSCQTHQDVVSKSDFDNEAENDPSLENFPPAVLLKKANKCHPYKVKKGMQKFKTCSRLIGKLVKMSKVKKNEIFCLELHWKILRFCE
eukprot:g6389.t1